MKLRIAGLVATALVLLSDPRVWRHSRAAMPPTPVGDAYRVTNPMSAATALRRSGSRSFRSE